MVEHMSELGRSIKPSELKAKGKLMVTNGERPPEWKELLAEAIEAQLNLDTPSNYCCAVEKH